MGLRCEELLRSREHGRFDVAEWYQFEGRSRGINEGGITKSSHPIFRLVAIFRLIGKELTTRQRRSTATSKHDHVWSPTEFLLAVLNSKILWFYL